MFLRRTGTGRCPGQLVCRPEPPVKRRQKRCSCARRQALNAPAKGSALRAPSAIGDETAEQSPCDLLMAGTRHHGICNAQFKHPPAMAICRFAGGLRKSPGFNKPRQPFQRCKRPAQIRDPVKRKTKRSRATDQRTLDNVDANGSPPVAQQQIRLRAKYGIRAFAVHPGAVWTELDRYMTEEDLADWGIVRGDDGKLVMSVGFKTAEQGAATSIWCATSPQLEAMGGLYCKDCDIAESVPANYAALNGVRP